MTVCAVYSRKSSDDTDRNEEARSTTRQVERAMEYARGKGWDVDPPSPRMRSPSQCPGTARSVASAGRWLIRSAGVTKGFPRARVRARGTRSPRPVRRHAVNSRRNAPRPCTYSAWRMPCQRIWSGPSWSAMALGEANTKLTIARTRGDHHPLPTTGTAARAGAGSASVRSRGWRRSRP